MAKPTRTTNRIRLTDLEDKRFEDLCLILTYPIAKWVSLNHIGRSGDDGGIDIHGIEALEDGKNREWVIQCKRIEKASAFHVKAAIDEGIKGLKSLDVFLLILACDLSRKARETYHSYALDKGIKTPQLWTLSEIEARLYNERKDLLFAFFGISEVHESRKKEIAIRRNISIKQRMHRAFRSKNPNLERARIEGRHQFASGRFIIRSIDDSSYPELDEVGNGRISSWFQVETWDYYWNGVEVCLGTEGAIVDKDGNWSLLQSKDDFDQNIYTEHTVKRIGRIPFRNIVDFDEDGDEFYAYPHLFCNFAEAGMPYEEMVFELSQQRHHRLEPSRQFVFKGPKSNRRLTEKVEALKNKLVANT